MSRDLYLLNGIISICYYRFFFFNDTAPTEIYTLSLHDALPIFLVVGHAYEQASDWRKRRPEVRTDRKSTRLNSSHRTISYAVFCLKKKKKQKYRVARSEV